MLEADEEPTTVRITYRVEDFLDDPTRITTEVLELDRPFRARARTYLGDGTDGELVTVLIDTELGTYIPPDPDGPILLIEERVPRVPSDDVRAQASIRDALDEGDAELGERRTVLGRDCQDVVTLRLLSANNVSAAEQDRRAITCLDASGLILREEFILSGRVARIRTATAIEDGVALTDAELFDGEPPINDGFSDVTVESLDEVPDGAALVRVPDGLPGFTFDAFTAQVRFNPETAAFTQTERRTWTRGPDEIHVDAIIGVTPVIQGFLVETALGEAVYRRTAGGTEVILEDEAGRIVVGGTVPLATLVGWIESMQRVG